MRTFLFCALPTFSLRRLALDVVLALALGAALSAPVASAQSSVAQSPPAQDAAATSRGTPNRVSTLPGPDAVAEHWTTGFPLTGAHERTRCESCHVRGEFKNTPKTCTGCHTAAARISTVVITSSHVPITQQCSACHNTLSFANAQFDHSGVVPGTCATCHNGTTATGKPSGHLVTSASCDSCHSTFSWTTVRFDHAGVTPGSCATCHNGARATAQPGSHIPTSLACDTCHSTRAWDPAPMNHVGIVNGCSNCHAIGQSFAGVTPMSPPATHIPFGTAGCESCHSAAAFASFAGTQMNHAPVAGVSCTTCHESGRSFAGVNIVTRPTTAQDPNHPVSGDCGSCHTSTASFRSGVSTQPTSHIPTSQPCTTCHATSATYAGGTMNHVGISSGCAACHASGLSFTGIVPVSPPPTHIPTSQPCELCHSPGKFTSFAGGTMTHAGIGSGCASCHAVGKSFFGVSVATPPATHVPVGTAACEGCHATAIFTSFGGTPMNHAPVAGVPCATCHEFGKSFFGVTVVTRPTLAQDANHPQTGECGSCHTSTVSFSAGVTAQPSNHIPTSQPCALCHLTPGNYALATMSHTGITSGCATCHAAGLSFANVIPVAPPATHLPITQTCETCHSAAKFTSFSGTTMNHAGIASGCDSCHASGKSYFGVTVVTPPATHIPFGGSACESCHAPAAFTSFGGTAMNHSAVGGVACATCHETGKSFYGVTIVTRPTLAQDKSHPQTGDCGSCHSSTTSFSTGVVTQPSNHIPTSQPCTLCHTTPGNFSVATMNHTGITSGCSACHAAGLSFANVVPVSPPATHVPTSQSCELCHSPAKFNNFSGGVMNHAGITSGCTNCHALGKSFYGVTVVTQPATHIPIGTAACESCHSTSTFTSFGGTKMNHAPVAGVPCATCHASGKTFYGVTIVTPPGAHIPFGTSACESCHSPAAFTNFGGTTMNHSAVAGIPCATCHETGKSFYGVTIVTRPTPGQDPNHPTSGDCGTCHTSTTSFSAGVTGMPANHIPTTQTCALCHTVPGNYAVATMNHAGIGSGCATCHASGLSFANIIPVSPPATHVPSSQPCELCHSPAKFNNFSGGTMSHNGITSGCDGCHASGKSFFGVTIVTPPGTHIPIGGSACESCHAAAKFTNFGGTAMNHAPVAGVPCATCHEGGRSFYGVTIVTRPTLGQDPNHPQTGDCGSCHSSTTSFSSGVTTQPPNHIPTTQPCALCHTTPGNFAVATMNHTGITSGCATCHASGLSFANVTPVSPPATHIPTSQACELCHSPAKFTNFSGGTMNHSGITSGCTNCHASGKSFFGVTIVTQPGTHIPIGSAACESCHPATKFTSFGGTSMNHAPVAGTPCATCHDAGKTFYGVTIVTRPTLAQDPNHPQTGECGNCHSSTTSFSSGVTTMPANHIPTTQPCALCHTTPGNYAVATMNHTGITSGCALCHATGSSFANIVPVTPPATHIPTSQPCELCHSATRFTNFSGTAMNHANISSGCANCHGTGKSFYGVTIVTPPGTHIPIGTAACETCHASTKFTNFGGTAMNHAPVGGTTCATCHEAGRSFFGVTIVTRPTLAQDPNHPQSGDCGTCHTSTTSFTSGITTMPPNHIPTSQPCALCHTTPGNYAVAAMNHTGITTGCATCHASGSSFANIVPVAPPATHVPTSQPCEFCHSPTKFTNFSGGAMNHTGITSGCANCHASGKSFFGVTIVTPPATHIPIGSAACETCHAPAKFTNFSGTAMNHAPVASTTCATCHASGKTFFGVTIVTLPTTGHIPNPSSLDCKGCHTSTTSFKTWTMNHSGISANCASCHDGQFTGVRSKPRDHPPTTADCSQCHNTNSFDGGRRATVKATKGTATMPARRGATPATTSAPSTTKPSVAAPPGASGATSRMRGSVHIGVMPGACASCHNGTAAPGRPARHLASSMSCDSCHRTTAWTPANYTHAGVAAGSCATCHNAIGAKGKPAGHFVTMRSCDNCHRATSWKPLAPYQHLSPLYPTRHPAVASCTVCHVGNSEMVTWRYPNLKPACDGCHGPNFRGGTSPATPPATGSGTTGRGR